jgi:hypothetical protein
MQNRSPGRPKNGSLIGPAALLGSGGAAGLWWALAPTTVPALLAAAVLALTAVPGTVWLARARTARRLNAAADAYATRELAREARWKARAQRATSPAAGRVS